MEHVRICALVADQLRYTKNRRLMNLLGSGTKSGVSDCPMGHQKLETATVGGTTSERNGTATCLCTAKTSRKNPMLTLNLTKDYVRSSPKGSPSNSELITTRRQGWHTLCKFPESN